VTATRRDLARTPDVDHSVGRLFGPAPGQRVILVRGDVDRFAMARLRQRCLGEPACGITGVVLDFSGMTGCSSALFVELVQINALLRGRRVALHLVGLGEAVAGIVGAPRPVEPGDRDP
jgi:anti-anti-sigma regulatory factor